ncbi:1-phosphofructokinase [Paenibacillus antri]|uniref:Tagatose-6-phosphate kinase n=1 Tax=Paenibacillus antri TaxID=2582848 RepID=A0A5R9GBF4_9BACL|nr:1-phosphofructokinase [Paenibacillus antri]TLS48745.1 1-phosphofructokinase [Paenibacillus antri]
MIATVTLNSAIDKTYYLGGFGKGGVYRVARQIAEPGGKGNNVAKVARLLGAEVAASGFAAGANGAFIVGRLAERGIRTAFVQAQGESRICLNIIDETDGSSTELLEQGPVVTETDVAELKRTLRELASSSSIVVLSGSLPQGVPVSLYAELIETIRTANAKAYLDTSGAAFAAALQAKPDFVKPNEQELAAWLGRELRSEDEVAQAASSLAYLGIGAVCVTLGGRGAIAFLDGKGYRVKAPKLEAVNTVGCGDSFVAGMAYAAERGASPEERLRSAAAAAAANAMSDRAGHLELRRYKEYLNEVEVTAFR